VPDGQEDVAYEIARAASAAPVDLEVVEDSLESDGIIEEAA
jgi:hypothetical protein